MKKLFIVIFALSLLGASVVYAAPTQYDFMKYLQLGKSPYT